MVSYQQCTPINDYIAAASYDSNTGIEAFGDPNSETNISHFLDGQTIYKPSGSHNFDTGNETGHETGTGTGYQQQQVRCISTFELPPQDQLSLEDEFVEGLLQFGSYDDAAPVAVEEGSTSPTFSDSTLNDNTQCKNIIPSSDGLALYFPEPNPSLSNFSPGLQSGVCFSVPIAPPTEIIGQSQKKIQSVRPIVQQLQSGPSFKTTMSSESLPEVEAEMERSEPANKHLDYFDPKYFDPESVEKAYRFFVKAVEYFSDKKMDGDRMFSPKQRAQEAMQLTIRCSASFEQTKARDFVRDPSTPNRAPSRKISARYSRDTRRRMWIRRKQASEASETEEAQDEQDQEKEGEVVSLTEDPHKTESKVGEVQQEVTLVSDDDLGNLQLNFTKPVKETDPLNRILSDKSLRKQLDDVVMRAWRRRGSRVNRKNFIYKIVKSPVVCPHKGCIFSVLGFRGEKVRMNHIEACHKRVNSLQCDICGMMLSRSDALIRHIKQQHFSDNKKPKKKASPNNVASQLEKLKTELPNEIPLEIFADPKAFKQKRLNPKFTLESIIKEKEEKLRKIRINEEQFELTAARDYLNLKPTEKAAYAERTREACCRSTEEQKNMRQHIEHMKAELVEKQLYRASFEKYDFDSLYAKAIENSTHGNK